MKTNTISMKLMNYFVIILLLSCSLARCDDEKETDREKRTIGALFRSFVDAFQTPTQRQPEPEVYSYQPLRPQRQQGNQPKQSTKVDLLSSSKGFIDEKKQKLRNLSTPAPETEIFIPSKIPPPPVTTATPSVQAQPVTQTQYYQTPQPQQSLPVQQTQISAPQNHPTNLLPPDGHHSLTPYKAQFLILPFQHQTQVMPFNFGLDPRLNYQADIYVQPPVGHHSGIDYTRFSPGNGWHDVDEILRGNVQSSNTNAKEDFRNKVESTTYNRAPSTEVNTKYPEQSTSVTAENEVGQKKDGQQNYQDVQKWNLINPLFIPNYQIQPPPVINLGHFENSKQVDKYPASPVNIHNQGFHQAIDEVHKKYIYEIMKNLQAEQINAQKNRETISSQGETGLMNSHDFVPQRAERRKYEEKNKDSIQHTYYHDNQNHYNYYNEEFPFQQSHDEHHRYPTKIGKLPDSLVEHQPPQQYVEQHPHQHSQQSAEQHPHQHSQQSAEQHPHQHSHQSAEQHLYQSPSAFNSYIDQIEHSASHFDGNYYKRST